MKSDKFVSVRNLTKFEQEPYPYGYGYGFAFADFQLILLLFAYFGLGGVSESCYSNIWFDVFEGE